MKVEFHEYHAALRGASEIIEGFRCYRSGKAREIKADLHEYDVARRSHCDIIWQSQFEGTDLRRPQERKLACINTR